MNDMIETRNAGEAPIENFEIPAGNPGIEAPTGNETGMFQVDDAPIANNNIGEVPFSSTLENNGLPSGLTQPVAESNFVEEAPMFEEPETPVEDPNRMQYWQSQADKAKNENFKIQQELEYYQNTLGPIANAIQSDPEILDRLEQKNLSNAPQQGSPAQGNLDGPLKQPNAPEKPHSYNEVDAYNDPESESFKFRLAKDQYRDGMIDYYGKVDAYRQQEQQAHFARQQETQAINQAQSYAMNNFGWDSQKSNDFITWAQNPNNVTMEHLAKIYDVVNSPSRSQVEAQQKVIQMQQQNQRMNVPRTATVEQGRPAPTMSDEQSFSAGLLSKKR
tara:strand:- start:3840 stop:4835 length:996 start_codon:yes stop_codon:yes gene_type:complete